MNNDECLNIFNEGLNELGMGLVNNYDVDLVDMLYKKIFNVEIENIIVYISLFYNILDMSSDNIYFSKSQEMVTYYENVFIGCYGENAYGIIMSFVVLLLREKNNY